jgi:shikimate dehydrogenase
MSSSTPTTVFTARQLIDEPDTFRKLDPPATLCVFGDPVAHSISPQIHNAALKACGMEAQYVRIHATEEEFPSAVAALRDAGFAGANVTIPHKPAALAAATDADERATLIGAANTLVIEPDGISAFNTDGPGLVRALRDEFYVDLRDLRVLLLGAGGGAGRAIALQCALERCERLVLVNRTLEKAQDLANELAPRFSTDRLQGPTDRCIAAPWTEESLAEQLTAADIIINASSVGMKRTDPPAVPANLLTANLLVFDTVYSNGKTKLLEDAEAAGARAANGLLMLLHQGALSFEIWFNRTAPIEAMRAALPKAAN